jgi:hypothetical protein
MQESVYVCMLLFLLKEGGGVWKRREYARHARALKISRLASPRLYVVVIVVFLIPNFLHNIHDALKVRN